MADEDKPTEEMPQVSLPISEASLIERKRELLDLVDDETKIDTLIFTSRPSSDFTSPEALQAKKLVMDYFELVERTRDQLTVQDHTEYREKILSPAFVKHNRYRVTHGEG